MRITHIIRGEVISGEGDAGFLLTNKKGNYLALRESNSTHYEGLYHFDAKHWSLFKSIENFELDAKITGIEKGAGYAKRMRGDATESFFLSSNAMLYEVENYEGPVHILLDCRKVHDFSEWGRIYEVLEEEGRLIFHYKKFVDADCSALQYEGFLVCACANGVLQFNKEQKWFAKECPYDVRRGSSHPSASFRVGALTLQGNAHFVFTFSKNKQKALEKAAYVLENYDDIRMNCMQSSEKFLTKKSLSANIASSALDQLTVRLKGGKEGIFAGLPWFSEFWARDEAVSLYAAILDERYLFAKELIFRSLENLQKDGRLADRYPPADIGSADAIGWLFKRVEDLLEHLKSRGILKDYFTAIELAYIRDKLREAIDRGVELYGKDGLFWNGPKETWMDTEGLVGDVREGARVEIQALYKVKYRVLRLLYKLTKKTNGKEYRQQERALEQGFRKFFLSDRGLADGITKDGVDYSIRPNVFLAAYLAPELLTVKEWKNVFRSALDELWLSWGGLSTIGRQHPWFLAEYTGQSNESYHRGDSWFFVNNIAAIVLSRLDRYEFKDKIRTIKDASITEMLFSGWAGACAEISGAARKESLGCFSQAWSAATLIELLHQLGAH